MTVLTRQALYARIWAEPVATVARDLGISDVGLRKICVAAQIPLPARGYWARSRAGQGVKPTPLPPRGPGMPDRVPVGEARRYGWIREDPEAELVAPPPDAPVFDEPVEAVRDRVAAQVGPVRYVRDLKAPHPRIAALLADDETRRLKPRGAPWRLMAQEPLFASAFEQRRLKVLNSLYLALQRWGAEPRLAGETAREPGVVVGGQYVRFSLDHPDAKPDRSGLWPTREGWADVLRLCLGAQSWSDTEAHGLDAFLSEIVVALIVAGEAAHRDAEREAHQQALRHRQGLVAQRERQRVEAERQAREAAIAAEQARREGLLAQAAALRQADEIRTLVARVRARRPDDAAAAAWGDWALGVAERLDPTATLSLEATNPP